MITRKSKSKILTKDISSECKCKFDGKNVVQINGGITINVDKKHLITIHGIQLHVVAKLDNI